MKKQVQTISRILTRSLGVGLLLGALGLNQANAQVYLAEGFSSATGTTPPAGWTNVAGPANVGPVGLWTVANPGARTITGADFGGKFFILDSDILGNGNTQDARLTTPSINLSTATNPLITFSEQFRFAAPQTGIIEYSTNGGATWTALATRTADFAYPNPAARTTLMVPGAAGQPDVKFRWNILTSWGWWWAIDSVVVREAVIPAPPTTLTFTAVGANATTINWLDNSTTETSFRVYRSTDNVNFTLASTVNSTTTVGTGTAYNYVQTGLNPGTLYYYRVVSFVEGESTALSGSQITNSAGVVSSTAGGGNWGDATTWAGGVVPTATDSVVIVGGSTVTVNVTTAACHALNVIGSLTYDATTASTLTVQNSVLVNASASFDAGTGTSTGHILRIGGSAANDLRTGSLIVNGVFDMYTTAGVTVTFFGRNNAQINGTPVSLDFYSVTVNKGNVTTNRPTLAIEIPFTVQGASTVGLIGTHTAGVVQINGTYTMANPIYSNASYTIPANGGLQLNNPNFTVSSTNGSPVCNGLLQVTQGIFNVSQTNAQVLGFGTGSAFIVNGGTVNAASRIATGNVMTFTFTSGNINVATVGNSTSGEPSFGITSGTSTVTWTGGTLTLVQRSTGATIVDYNVAPIAGITTGTLQIGDATTATNFDFRIGGNVPNLVIDNTTNNKTAMQRAQLNVWGNITVNTGTTLNLNGYALLAVGASTTNNGFIDGRTAGSNFVFYSTTAGHTYGGTGLDTLQSFSNQNTVGGITFTKPVVAYRTNFFSTTSFINSSNITLGNGLAQAVTVQIGVANFTGVAGIFDAAPTFNLGTGTYSLIYQQEGALRTTGIEVPVSRSVFNLTVSDTNNVTLAGGPLDVTGTFTLAAGRLNTTGTNLLRVTNSTEAAVTGGSATSYVNGPLQRRLPASLTTASTYRFPVGKGTTYSLFEMVNSGTNPGGTVDIVAERFNTATGGTPDGTSINLLTPQYWSVAIAAGAGNIDSTTLRLTTNGLVGINRVAFASTLTGSYSGVSSGPGVGNITTSKLVGSAALEGFFTIGEIIIPISGSFIIGASQVAPNYTTITAAMADISTKQVQGNITLLLDADYLSSMETFPVSLNQFASNNVNHTITIKPNTGVSASIIGAHGTTVLRFTNNAANYIIDGSNNGTNSRNLFIQNTTPGAATVMFQGTAANQGVSNTVLKNTIIKGGDRTSSYGLIVGGTTVGLSSGGFGHKNITIENNNIYNNNYAVVISGTSGTNKVSSTLLLKNEIGTDSAAYNNHSIGVYLTNADSITLNKNIIKNVKTVTSINNSGITIDANTTNSIISQNTIKGIHSTSSGGWGAFGMLFNTNTGVDNITVRNNSISDILTSNYTLSATTTYNAYGIRILGGSNLKFYFNSVHLFGQPTTGSSQSSSAALTILSNTLTGFDMRNNIFSNRMTGTIAGSKHYAIATYGPIPGSIFDYNDFIANSTQGVLMTAYNPVTFTSADVVSLADLKTATAANNNSHNINPQFVNDSTLITGLGTVGGLGTTIAGITLDIIDSVRATPPTIGAFEKGVDISGPSITYTPLTNTFLLTNRVLTGFAAMTDFNGVDTLAGTKPRIYFRKSGNANVLGTYPGDNNSSFDGWKYVEAANQVSPFTFTLDYSLLFGGGTIASGDTIFYFVTAQDRQAPAFVSANPSAGFAATSVNNITALPTTVNRFLVTDPPLAGVYLVGSANTSPNFTTLTSAVAALNTRGMSAAVEFHLTDAVYNSGTETYPLVINQVNGASASARVTIRPTLPGTIISGTATAIFRLNGADYITIDGMIVGDTSRNLTIVDSSASSTTINFVSLGAGAGCFSDSIRNCNIYGPSISNTSSSVIHIGGSGYDVSGSDHRNIVLNNNEIAQGYKGVTVYGTSSGKTKGLVLHKNNIGSNAARITWRGIDVSQIDSARITNNTVQYIISTNTNIKAIALGNGTTNSLINANMVDSCTYTGTGGWGLIGIFVDAAVASNTTISNNMLSRLTADGYRPVSSTDALIGIRLASGSNYNVYHNTVCLSGTYAGLGGETRCAAMHVASTVTGINLRNNIFINGFVNSGGAPGWSYAFASDAPAAAYTDVNYNNYYASGIQASLGWASGANQLTLGDMTTAIGANANSISDSTNFVSAANLHLAGPSIGDMDLKSMPIVGNLIDFDGETRAAFYAYMGADENTASPLPVNLTQFNAVTKGADAVLTWTTASETNNSGFEVQRSVDGVTFEKAGFVKGAGNSTRELNYTLTDVKAFDVTNSNVIYYRLKQVDFDGKFTYSKMVRVNKTATEVNALSLFPNPYSTDYSISFTAASNGTATVEMVDIQGKTVVTQESAITSGSNTLLMNEVANLKHGIYFVRITVNGETQVLKLVKN